MVKVKGGMSGSVNRLKKEMERSSGGRTWLKGIKEDITVRFLTEPDQWYAFREHYSPDVNFFPCVGKDEDCPGCLSDSEKVQRSSRRFAANVLDVNAGQVIPLKLPLDLAQRLVARYERNNNTLMNRDYTLHRMGKGLDTTYDVTPEDKSEVDISNYPLFDLEEILVHQFEDAFDLDSEPESSKPVSSMDTDSDLDDEVPSEPSATPDEDDDDGYLTEEEALKMSKDELKALADQLSIELDGRWSKEKMVQHLFAEAG